MAPTLRIFRLALMLVIFPASAAVTSPEEATAACALENEAVASCDEFGDDASRRLLGRLVTWPEAPQCDAAPGNLSARFLLCEGPSNARNLAPKPRRRDANP